MAPKGANVPGCSCAAKAVDASQRHRTPRRGSARMGVYHRRPGEPQTRAENRTRPGDTPALRHIRSWRDVSCGTGTSLSCLTIRQRAARRVPKKVGGPDVARHAAAAACDGKGIRVDGLYRTCAGFGCLDWLRIAHQNLAHRRPVPGRWRGCGARPARKIPRRSTISRRLGGTFRQRLRPERFSALIGTPSC